MDKVYKACADATRRKILKLLRDKDMSAGEIAAHFQLTKPTLSKHFAVLREAGLVRDVKIGRSITYHINADVLENALLSLMEEYGFVWTPSGDIALAAHELVELLVKEEFEVATRDFDTQITTLLPPEKLKDAWDQTIGFFGRTEKYRKFTSVIVTCEFAKSKIDIKVTFNRTGKISGFWILKTD
jgi:DNA-binding transcriptional ArsR family regulator